MPTLLSLAQQVLIDHRLTGHEPPEVDVTAVERAETVPATATATGFTLEVTNDLAARRSAITVDSDVLSGNDDGVLLVAAPPLRRRRAPPGRRRPPHRPDHPVPESVPSSPEPPPQPLIHHHP